MENILLKEPWIPYVDNFIQSQIVLTYPKNMIFTSQILTNHLKNTQDIYKKFPYAEKFNINLLSTVDWNNTTLTFDKDLNLILAPEPVKKLINLNKRLNYKKAYSYIFFPFQFIGSFALIVSIFVIIYFSILFRRYDLWRRSTQYW